MSPYEPTYSDDVDLLDEVYTGDCDLATRLGIQLGALRQSHLLTITEQRKNRSITQSLQALIDNRWPGRGLTLEPFGSTVTGLATKSSDLDLVLTDPSRPDGRWTAPNRVRRVRNVRHVHIDGERLPEWYDVAQVCNAVSSSRFVSSTEPIASRVPLARLQRSDGRGKIEIVVNNAFSAQNSRLIRTYVDLAPHTLPALHFAVRYWLRNRGLNDSGGHDIPGLYTLSTYAITLLVIQFLQEQKRLPNLQDPGTLHWVPRHLHEFRRDGTEPYRRTFGERQSDETVKEWNVTFADPFNAHDEILDVDVNDGIRVFVPYNLLFRNRRPNNFSSWLNNWPAMHGQSIWAHLPSPSSSLMHKLETRTPSELGQLFLDFIPWFTRVVFDGTVVDIVHGSTRSMNMQADQDDYFDWVSDGKVGQPPEYDLTQPLVWKLRMMVIADPFVKCRNVAVGLHGRAMYKLRYEIAKAHRLKKRHQKKGKLDFLKMARPGYGRYLAEQEEDDDDDDDDDDDGYYETFAL